MPTIAKSAKRFPGRPKRVSPPDPAYQLKHGRPSEELQALAWRMLFQSSAGLPPYELHLESVGFIRYVSLEMEKFVRNYGRRPIAFSVISDNLGRLTLFAESPCPEIFELFCEQAIKQAAAVVLHFPEHKFHPLFGVYLDLALRRQPGREYDWIGRFYDYFFRRPLPEKLAFFNAPHIFYYKEKLNALCEELYRRSRALGEGIKSFRRTAQETRLSLMRYNEHLLENAPKPYIGRFAVYRPSRLTGNKPVTHEEIQRLRRIIIKTLKSDTPNEIYLGYSILLRHNAQYGYWLDIFVYFRNDDLLRWADKSMQNLLYTWRSRMEDDKVDCVGYWMPAEEQYDKVLALTTMATEFDFYCRVVSPEKARSFWCSQSPIGRLSKRTHVRKRSAKNAKSRDAKLSLDPLTRFFQEENLQKQAELKLYRWEWRLQKHRKLLSDRRIKAALKRKRGKERDVDRS
ncbi:hypothetical protein [Paraburkholderia sp. SUR17]|uniref:hypothetical protein n=1 Tax=Paraburkholderia sp. SUR17 TaxID=3034358 RepID=UPI0024088C18|nr:hypothetical protein [Paraburkholderia sp. SUR17]WEY37773.1 hypothetical protein P2869_11870 [Paraburkholderia sp. SUR17]